MIIRNARYKQVLPGVVGYKGNLYTKAYAKGELLFDYTNDEYETQYFTTESLEDGNVITFTIGSNVTTSDLTSISYSTDGGLTWTTTQNTASTTQTINVNLDAGDKVLWKGSGTALGAGYEETVANVSRFSSTKKYSVYGNIMSLLYGDNFSDKTSVTDDYAFCGLFYQSTNLVDAENLVIPIKNINQVRTFVGMFRGCTSLVTNPKFAPESITAQHGCMRMFRDCTSLEKTVDLSHLTTITGGSACLEMYRGCTSLREVDKLPATTLYEYCYQSMFKACTSLTTAPELPAPTLAVNCYREMFYGCTSLNCIKCLATDISASNCTQNWVYNVAPTGDFIKDPSMNDWLIDNVNGIPIGWTLHGVATYTVTLTVNDANMGVADGAGNYSAGDQVVLRAEPYEGYSFVGWYNGSTLVSSDTTYVFNIYSNISYEARFAQSQQDEYLTQYFTIETLYDNCKVYLMIPSNLTPQDMVRFDYSLDNGVTWVSTQIDNTAKNIIANLPVTGDKILFRGIGNRTANNSSSFKGCTFKCTRSYKVYGNIMSLLYGDNFVGQNTLTEPYAFAGLFDLENRNMTRPGVIYTSGTQKLVDAQNLRLPATTLSNYCYYEMFKYCDALVKGPSSLPATTLGEHCYESMFDNCIYMVECPSSLPATTLAEDCYCRMFRTCNSLEVAPSMSATTLAPGCCFAMFSFCNSLTTAPALSATTLASNCYAVMFWYCTSLVNAPSLPATNVPWMAYSSMFADCTSLVNAPSLPATTLGNGCYKEMFEGCTSLATAPALPATDAVQSCYEMMFYGCTSLTNAPDLPATTLGTSCYYKMFYNTKIQSLKIYGVSSPYTINFGTINYSNGIYYTKPNATSNILNAKPDGWTISKTL